MASERPTRVHHSAVGQAQVTLALLTHCRNHLLERQLQALASWQEGVLAEVLVVDNASDPPADTICQRYPWVRVLRASENLGAAGRNLAFDAARTRYLITLDDDVLGLNAEHVRKIQQRFETDHNLAAINFQVREENTERLVNWVHHCDSRRFAHRVFETYEITEGAVAFRVECLRAVGGYPQMYFLSHEGPDLAFRLMDQNWRVIYSPEVVVHHLFAPEGRASWRQYYYDARNTWWLAARHLPVGYGVRLVARQSLAMGFYAIRDGFVRVYLRACWHGLRGLPQAFATRKPLAASTMQRIRQLDARRPSLWETMRARLFAPPGQLRAPGA